MTKLICLALAAVALPATLHAGFEEPRIENIGEDRTSTVTYLNPDYLVFDPTDAKEDAPIPLVIYLHGAGGVGDDITKIKGQASRIAEAFARADREPCLIVAPQCQRDIPGAEGPGGWLPDELNVFLEHVLETHPQIDKKRIYLTGNSMGGYGCWVWGGHYPDHFAAIAPVVGGIGPEGPKDVTPHLDKWAANLAKVPVYAFAGAQDRVVPAEYSERMVKAIHKAGGENAQVKVFPDEGHGAGRVVLEGDEFFDWMFSQKQP
ncbi:MAG: prolyl oligopeptidase family serine peptidase [Verrucomicrobiota bacterium]